MAKAKQKVIPGMESPTIDAIDNLADKYFETKAALKLAKCEHDDCVTLLCAQMKSNRLTNYVTAAGRAVRLDSVAKVKVGPPKKKDASDE